MKNILLIEDNDVDIKAFKKIIADSDFNNSTIKVIKDGAEALDFVINKVEKEYEFWPDIVFLDQNLPLKNGDVILRYMKNKPYLKTIPIIIVSNSTHQNDILSSYNYHVNAYINKAMDIDVFEYRILRSLDYWLRIVEPPDRYVIKQAKHLQSL